MRSRFSAAALLLVGAVGALLAASACSDQPTALRPVAAPALGKGGGGASASIVLFVGNQTGASRIYAMNADGANIRPLTDGTGDDVAPDLSPDNRRFVFVRQPLGTEAGGAIFVAPINGGKAVQLTPASMFAGNPAWSPDGTRIAFDALVGDEGKHQVFVMNADGTGVTQLSQVGATSVTDPTWSPDGQTLVMVADPVSGPASIVSMQAKLGAPVILLQTCSIEPGCAEPAFSPSGTPRIAYTDAGRHVLVTAELEGGPSDLTAPVLGIGHPAWSADGTRIVFHSGQFGTIDLFTVDAADQSHAAVGTRLTSLGGSEAMPATSH